MSWFQAILGVLLLGGVIFGWVALQRKFRDDDAPLIDALKRRPGNEVKENDLEAFIAAYRDGKVDPTMLASGEDSVDTTIDAVRPAPALSPADSTGTRPAPAAASMTTAPAVLPPGTLLRPEVKLAYLTFRSGLRDHHVFANVRLGDLGFGTAVGVVDLLVCDGGFKYVAAIDVYTGEQPDDVPKSMFLRRAGVRYLTFSAKAMPKPSQLRDLVYGNQAA